mgnify:CR=1 FL=1
MKNVYQLDLSFYQHRPSALPVGSILFNPSEADEDALGELMLAAYSGTIDYEGETLEEAQAEIGNFFSGSYGEPLYDCSLICFVGDCLTSACLVSWWEPKAAPLITYVITHAYWKRHGLATAVLQRSLHQLQQAEFDTAYAFVTPGNRPSEKLLGHTGFIQLCPVA